MDTTPTTTATPTTVVEAFAEAAKIVAKMDTTAMSAAEIAQLINWTAGGLWDKSNH